MLEESTPGYPQRRQTELPHVQNNLPEFIEMVRQLKPGQKALLIDRYDRSDMNSQVRRHVARCADFHNHFGDHLEVFLAEQIGREVIVEGCSIDGLVDENGFEHDEDSFGSLVTVVK